MIFQTPFIGNINPKLIEKRISILVIQMNNIGKLACQILRKRIVGKSISNESI